MLRIFDIEHGFSKERTVHHSLHVYPRDNDQEDTRRILATEVEKLLAADAMSASVIAGVRQAIMTTRVLDDSHSLMLRMFSVRLTPQFGEGMTLQCAVSVGGNGTTKHEHLPAEIVRLLGDRDVGCSRARLKELIAGAATRDDDAVIVDVSSRDDSLMITAKSLPTCSDPIGFEIGRDDSRGSPRRKPVSTFMLG